MNGWRKPSGQPDGPLPAPHVQMQRSVQVADVLSAMFALVALVALVARPIHYERTLALGLILALALGAYGYLKSRPT
jgi:hypothetical protein